MSLDFSLFPDQASTMAARVDALFYFLTAVSLVFGSLIFFLVIYFAVRYRRRSEQGRPKTIAGDFRLEILWTVIPLGLAMVMFAWGAAVYSDLQRPPSNALEIFAVGKQWMWKFQHPEGMREINELHVPVGHPVKLTMTSEDVIHSVFVPAFRVKHDVLPGRYTTVWFEATKKGKYHLFCAEYCGTQHSGMLGYVVVMETAEYQRWLSGGASGISLAQAGELLFQRLGCATCHRSDGTGRGPALVGLYGKRVQLERGARATADEDYLRESIIEPNKKIVSGYQPIMPTFKGLVSEEGVLQIIAYINSLKTEGKKQVAQ